jgi:predicted nucleic acid-binding protein
MGGILFCRPRDLCHLASCLRRGVREIKTFDQTLAEVSSFLFSS